MIFVTYSQLAADVIAWSEQLPRDIDLVVGVPRSGMLPASILALHRNIALSDVDTFVNGDVFDGGFRDQHRNIKKVLIVDDSSLSGRSLKAASHKLRHRTEQVFYGAVYAKSGANCLHYKKLEPPRIFEWNMFHSYWTQRSCMDIDGVLCRDPTNKENDDGRRYLHFIQNATPRHIPTVQIHTLVTGRLEKYRSETVKWLHRNKISYKNLVMHPAGSKSERQIARDHAHRKAHAFIASKQAIFFESSEWQAEEIHRLTNKPVICTDNMRLYV